MPKKHILYFLISIYFIIITTSLSANSYIKLEDSIESYTHFNVEYFEDTSEKELTIDQVRKESFHTTSNAFTFGYNTNNFWFRMTVVNDSDKSKEILLELTELIHKNVDLYIVSANSTRLYEKNGLAIPVKERHVKVSNPTFLLQFSAHEKKEIYIKLSSIYGVFGAIQMKTHATFHYDYNIKENLYMFYFGAIIMIGLYNLFIFLYLREVIYLYYVSYVFIFVVWSANYKGLLLPYITIETYNILQMTIPIFFTLLVLFSQSVLETKKYFLTFHKILNIFIVISVISMVWMLIDMHTGFYVMNLVASPFLPFLLFVAAWALYKGHSIAKIYLLALFIYLIGMIILSQLALGIIPYSILFSNAPIIGSFFEIMLLSLLLAYRINLLRQDSLDTQKRLLKQEATESIRLSKMVAKKTTELSTLNEQLAIELEEKQTLYQELNHRVKNNLLMILSLIKLQISRTRHTESKKELIVTQNRIHSISNLYEHLHLHDSGESINTLIHFKNIIENIQQSTYEQIEIKYDVTYNLNKDNLLYAGLILNELATNAFKYAFSTHGTLHVSLYKNVNTIFMTIEDDGPGFDIRENDSLGLTIVRTLVDDQLFGKMDIISDKKTKITIIWEEDE